MSGRKQSGSGGLLGWGLAAIALAGWFLSAKPKPAPAPREVAPIATVAPRPEPPPPPPIQPAALLAAAKAFASYGLTFKEDRVAAYTLASGFLAAVPPDAIEASEASILQREVEARRKLRDVASAAPASESDLNSLMERLQPGARPGLLAVAPKRPTKLTNPATRGAAPRAPPLPQRAQLAEAAPRTAAAWSGTERTQVRATPIATTTGACAENGSCFGDISEATGRPKTTHVNGYYRRDGAYVRGHYRSK